MHILLVSAYPESASFGGQLVSQLRQHLRARGDVVAVSDLHRMNFPAIARKRQFAADAFFDLQAAQARATADRTLPRAVQAEQDKVRTADMIVFLAPVYWASPPAIMRGWLEQVLTPGFAYDRDRAFDGGLLAGKSAFFVTTHAGKLGAATVAGAQARMQDLLAPLEDRPLHYSGIRTLPALALSPPDYKDISARVQALDTALQAVVAKIDTPLPEMRTVHPLINLNGRPGVGKKTVAHLLAGYIGATVVDNHTLLNPGAVAAGRSTPGYYRVNRAVRAAVFAELAETLQQRPVILTNALVNEIDEHQEIAAEIALLARKSGAPLHSFNLTADFNENARRVVTPDRALDMKLTDAGKLAEMFRDFTVITPPGTRVIDTTAHSALQTARIIRDYLPELAP